MPANNQFDHFVQAQQDTFARACAELAAGRKESHWMWFIFPQLAGLGSSSMAQRYSIASLGQAAEYLIHPVLGPRLHQVTQIVNDIRKRSASQIFGYPDDLKFHSSITLFALATERSEAPNLAFRQALASYFKDRMDQGTMKLLAP